MDVSWTQKRKINFLLFVNISMTFPSSSHRAKAARMQSWWVLCHRECLQPVLTLHYGSLHSLSLIWFSLPTFVAEWTQLNFQSHRELEMAVAAGPWTGFNSSSLMLFSSLEQEWLWGRSFGFHGQVGIGPDGACTEFRGTSTGRNGWFTWKLSCL